MATTPNGEAREPRTTRKAATPKRVFDAATKAAVLDLIHDGCTLDECAAQIGWSITTITKHRKSDRDFDAGVTEALEMRGALHAAKFDDELRGEYLARLREGRGRHAAARDIGIDPGTVWRHAERDDGFAEAMRAAENEADEDVEQALRKRALGAGEEAPHPTALIFWLTNRQPGRWADRRAVRIGGEPGNPLRTTVEDPADFMARLMEEGGDEAADLLERFDDLARRLEGQREAQAS